MATAKAAFHFKPFLAPSQCAISPVRTRDVDAWGLIRSRPLPACKRRPENPRRPKAVGEVRRQKTWAMEGSVTVITTTIPTDCFHSQSSTSQRRNNYVDSDRLDRLHALLFVFADASRTSLPIGKASVYAYLFAAERALV